MLPRYYQILWQLRCDAGWWHAEVFLFDLNLALGELDQTGMLTTLRLHYDMIKWPRTTGQNFCGVRPSPLQ